jgi:hypothetical protein
VSIADDLVAAWGPWLTDDLEDYARAIGKMFEQVELYIDDDPYGDGNGAWSILLDPDRSPYPDGLAYLAQWIGERIPPGTDEETARFWITDGPNQSRGTELAIARATQRSLTGTRLVLVFERQMPDGSEDPNGDHFTVVTYDDQTPNPDLVWQDLLTVIPADMVCNYEHVPGQIYATLLELYPTYADVLAQYPHYGGILADRPGGSIWVR